MQEQSNPQITTLHFNGFSLNYGGLTCYTKAKEIDLLLEESAKKAHNLKRLLSHKKMGLTKRLMMVIFFRRFDVQLLEPTRSPRSAGRLPPEPPSTSPAPPRSRRTPSGTRQTSTMSSPTGPPSKMTSRKSLASPPRSVH